MCCQILSSKLVNGPQSNAQNKDSELYFLDTVYTTIVR